MLFLFISQKYSGNGKTVPWAGSWFRTFDFINNFFRDEKIGAQTAGCK
jgi:hypothetical protein